MKGQVIGMNGSNFSFKDNLAVYKPLSEDVSTEVLVVGGGITGILSAYYLMKNGFSVMLAEKNVIGSGNTRYKPGCLNSIPMNNFLKSKNRLGIENTSYIYNENLKSIDNIENIINELKLNPGFENRDLFFFTDRENHIDAFTESYKLEKHTGAEAEFYSKSDGIDLFSFDFEYGIYNKREGAVLNIVKFAKQLTAYLSLNGVRIFENTCISDIMHVKNRYYARTSEGIGIEAKYISDCRGEFTDRANCRKNSYFTYISKPIMDFRGWHNKCNLTDDYSNPLVFAVIEDRITVHTQMKNPLKNTSVYYHMKLSWIEQILNEMFFGIQYIKPEHAFIFNIREPITKMPALINIDKNFLLPLNCFENSVIYADLLGRAQAEALRYNKFDIINKFNK